jgi:hypothetical protein
LYKVKIYIWYQRFVGFRGTLLWTRVWLGTMISLVTVDIYGIDVSREKKWRSIQKWILRSLMGKFLGCGSSRWKICWWTEINGSWYI